MTAVILWAEARRAAWIIRRSSTRWSLTGGEHDWTRKTSAPRIDSPEAAVRLAVPECLVLDGAEVRAEAVGDSLRQLGIRRAREDEWLSA